jgi:hypothetical protein
MIDPDSLDALLREEWKAPEPTAALEQRMTFAYRSAVRPSVWWRFWKFRVSVPAPVLVAAMLTILALLLWLRPTAPPAVSPEANSVVTRLNASGFQPLPNGEARIIPAMEIKK